MFELLGVEERVDPFTGTAAVETVEADIETSRIVDAVEAERAVFAVDCVGGFWRGKVARGDVIAGCHDGEWVAGWGCVERETE